MAQTARGRVQMEDMRINTWRMSSWALEIPSECSSRKSLRGSTRRDMMMELMKREEEQLRRQVTDMTWTGVLVKRYVVPVYTRWKRDDERR